MSSKSLGGYRREISPWIPGRLKWLLVFGAVVVAGLLVWKDLPVNWPGLINQVFALKSEKVTWFITRSAGWSAYLLLWASTAWGIAVPSKIFDGLLERQFTYDFHEFLSLLALGFTGVHIAVLVFDQYEPFSLAQLFVPFVSNYRPVWVGIGIIALYLTLLVTVTFYARQRIGSKAFRRIHLLSLLAFFGSALHGLFAGTDSSLPAAQFLYAVTFLSVIFLIAYWLVALFLQKSAPVPAVLQPEKVDLYVKTLKKGGPGKAN